MAVFFNLIKNYTVKLLQIFYNVYKQRISLAGIFLLAKSVIAVNMRSVNRDGEMMKVLMLNGSPKAKYSITLQTALYIEENFPGCSFEAIHVGQRIRAFEKDMTEVLEAIACADLLLFCYPVYTFLAPYQLHRFIELLKESAIDLHDKYAAQLTTSKHFYDVTAHRYIEENCADLGMRYLGGLSADMDDLLTAKGQGEVIAFWKSVLFRSENGLYQQPCPTLSKVIPAYSANLTQSEKREGFDIAVVTNCEPGDDSLRAMIGDFCALCPYPTRVFNIAEYPFSGGCLGCFNCAVSGKCVYKDGFDDFLRKEIQTASAIVYAFTIRDHSMGASFKRYDDRQFCNGHRTVMEGMPMGYILNGDYESEPNLRMLIEGRSEVGGNYLAGVATNAEGINRMSEILCYALENKLALPRNFYGVGGMKIFRDLIYLMRGMMKADHRFYKDHGFYDFPQKKVGTIFKMHLVGMLLSNPKIKGKMGNKMNEGMIAPYKKILKK